MVCFSWQKGLMNNLWSFSVSTVLVLLLFQSVFTTVPLALGKPLEREGLRIKDCGRE